MEHKAPHPLAVIRAIQTSCGDFLEVQRSINQRRNGAPQIHKPPQRWFPPLSNIIKVNVDASWRSNVHQAGVGIFLRSASGEFVVGGALPIMADSPLLVEALAVLEGCKFAKQQGCDHIVRRLSMLFNSPFQEASGMYIRCSS
ncbi:hypothetical protein L3X38_036290 [Prunus dulcis]|uniref:RNase H type-1 domain-containing protein n=1 Tax=Prunus dulcis TaxID=3755 RepID=A0AAD4YQ82_PRUDU|nr:hypothetical protein L3X38_036290 [Prunus dulcis]